MKFIASLFLSFIFSGIIVAQESSVGNYIRYSDSPVDIYTGIPDISVPFASLPTRNNDISIGTGLQYHPLNGVAAGASAGTCGLGWNTIDEEGFIEGPDSVLDNGVGGMSPTDTPEYHYNFMGYSGKFKLKKNPNISKFVHWGHTQDAKQPQIRLSFVDATVTNQYGSKTYVTSFIFSDLKGNQYIFSNFTISSGIGTWRLTNVKDSNNQELLKFDYTVGTRDITSSGYGKFSYTYTDTYPNRRLSELQLFDTKGTLIKKMKLIFENNQNKYLNKVQISDMGETKKEIYEFSYNGNNTNTGAYDHFGFNTVKPYCFSHTSGGEMYNYPDGQYPPSPSQCLQGVLTKMILPTGGCILYDYESNAYSNCTKDSTGAYHQDVEQFYAQNQDILNGVFYDYFPLIPENFIEPVFLEGSFNYNGDENTYPSSLTFTLTESKDLYFNITEVPVTFTPTCVDGFFDGGEVTLYPEFKIYGNTPESRFYSTNHSADYTLDSNKNFNNKCLGEKIALTPGEYTISISVFNPYSPPLCNFQWGVIASGFFQIKEVTRNPDPIKQFYGGGIRIKRIGYFDRGDIPVNYYSTAQTIFPVKELNYDYNFFDNPNVSSGYTRSVFNGNDVFSGYQNVTVRESQNNGKIQYTYTHSSDNELPGNNLKFAKNGGLLIKKEIFDSSNFLSSSTDYYYDFDGLPTESGGFSSGYPLAKSNINSGMVTQITANDYFKNSTNSISTTKYFSYNSLCQPDYELFYNSLGEPIKTITLYKQYEQPKIGNEIVGNIISFPSITATYRTSELLSTFKIDYYNAGSGNQSYKPQTIEIAKGANPSQVVKRITKYDEFSHVLEEQQENGLVTSYIYGYNKTQIIAKIENATYNQVQTALGVGDMDTVNETNMTAIDGLRTALSNAMITTYTYKPLVGVLSVTDPKGDTIFYDYDTLGRQINVKDKDGNLLSETEYKFVNQN